MADPSETAEVLGKLYDFHSDLKVLSCGACHIRFAMPHAFYDACMEKDDRGIGRKVFYCPNGHRLAFHDREIDQLRRDRDLLQQRLARIEDEKAEAERGKAEAEKALARNVHRAAAGICPCCQRSFRQLALHMQTQHPDMAAPKNKPPTSSTPVTLVRKVRGRWAMISPVKTVRPVARRGP